MAEKSEEVIVEKSRKKVTPLKFVLAIAVVATVVVVAKQVNAQQMLQNALSWIQDLGPVGAIVFIGLYSVATVFFVPGSLLTLGAGVVFGVVAGSIYVFLGATIGATAAFLVGRYLALGWISRQIENNPKFSAIDEAVAREGLKIVILTRLSPIFPFNLLNYAFGVTRVSLKDYILGCVGMIPGTIMYVYIGSLAGNLAMLGTANSPISQEAQFAQWTLRIVGFIATVAVTLYVTRLARKALQETVNTNS
jgi:uncharacterized membrane protein YdjX (TVP38/TMEM64 family)